MNYHPDFMKQSNADKLSQIDKAFTDAIKQMKAIDNKTKRTRAKKKSTEA